MKPTFLIILLISPFIVTAQVKKDSLSNHIYPGAATSAKDLKNPALNLDTYSINPFFNGIKIITDSTYIAIYHTKPKQYIDFAPAYYMDSIRVNSLAYIDPKDISDIKIIGGKDSINKIWGKVFVTLKKHSYHFITIENLTKRCIPNFDSKTQAVIYVLNDKLVTDTANMIFEITYIRNVEVTDGSQIKAFKGLLSSVTVLKINTGDAPIYLRGSSTPESFKQ